MLSIELFYVRKVFDLHFEYFFVYKQSELRFFGFCEIFTEISFKFAIVLIYAYLIAYSLAITRFSQDPVKSN